ncbi:MAG TPA: pimeloyl-ACP methyl ester esterase BioH [Xanthomonadaceae bacterium]|nr:pimeloyl-ACP methyl ester esterase BioH [Xanthomonadaceae bacterium]
MHIERIGRGPPLVLLHGWAMHGGVFHPLAAHLRDRFELHLVDLPGHGHSRGDPLPLRECVDALVRSLPAALWLGWSLGGLLALEAALRHRGRVHGLVMLCASPRFVAAEDWPHAVAPEVLHEFRTALATDDRGTVDRFLALETFGSEHMRRELAMLRAQVSARGEPAPHALAEGLCVLERTDLRAALPTLAVPSLWVGGRRDRLVPAAAMQRAADLAGGSYRCVEGAGHAPLLGHAEHVAAAIDDFAQSTLGVEAMARSSTPARTQLP